MRLPMYVCVCAHPHALVRGCSFYLHAFVSLDCFFCSRGKQDSKINLKCIAVIVEIIDIVLSPGPRSRAKKEVGNQMGLE